MKIFIPSLNYCHSKYLGTLCEQTEDADTIWAQITISGSLKLIREDSMFPVKQLKKSITKRYMWEFKIRKNYFQVKNIMEGLKSKMAFDLKLKWDSQTSSIWNSVRVERTEHY